MARATYKKKITSDEIIAKINPENISLMNRFLKTKNTNSSDTTILSYKSDLTIFFCWNYLENGNKLFTDIRKIEFSDFFSYCVSELKYQSSRHSRLRACLSSFSNFIEKYYDDVYPNFRNVILKCIETMPKSAAREKTVLSEEQVNKLKAHLLEEGSIQELCLLSLAISSGARISELLRFKVTDIDENNTAFDGFFLKTCTALKTKGRSKVGKMIYKFILKDEFLPNYNLWLPLRNEIVKNTCTTHDFIFVNKKGEPLTEGNIRTFSEQWGKYLGEDIYFHAFRHFFVTNLSKIGLEKSLVVLVTGWENDSMFSIYDDRLQEDMEWKSLDKLKEHIDGKS